MTPSLTDKLQELLVQKKLVSPEDLAKAQEIAREQGGKLGDILIKMNVISKENLLAAISEGMDIPPMDIARLAISEDVLSLIPRKICERYMLLPISSVGNMLTVVMADPLNIFALDDLKAITKMDVSPVIADEDNVKEALQRYFEKTADEEISEIMGDIEGARMEMVSEGREEEVSSGELLRISEETPVVKLTNLILNRGVKEGASDIMIEPMERNSRVRYRIDGVLRERQMPPKGLHRGIISRLKVMSNLNIAERRLPQDGRFMIRTEGRRVDFRLSVIPTNIGEKACLRILDKAQTTIDIERLGFRKEEIEKIRKASEKPHGLILVCGPTGCGKTTTLYSILKHVDAPQKNLVTVEDPVEYELKGINQVSINDDIGLTFAACLRSILRQDPDVIMVGEIRDFDTVDIAIKSALTGHMVLSTLHTNTASGSVVRLVNMGVEPFLLSSSLELVAAQRLLRKLCNDCKEPYVPDKEVAEKFGLFDKNGKIPTIYRAKGCKKCFNFGYKGRVGMIECLEITDLIKDLLFKNAQEAEIEKAACSEGMTTLREGGILNVISGVTSLEEIIRTTVEGRE